MLRRQLVDATVDDALDRSGKVHRLALSSWGKLNLLFDNADESGFAEREGQLLAEERVALGHLLNVAGHRRRKACRPQSPADQPFDGAGRQHVEIDDSRCRVAPQFRICNGRFGVHRPGHDDHENRRDFFAHADKQLPGGRIKPLRVVKDQDQRRAGQGFPDQCHNHFVGVVLPCFSGQLLGQRVLGQI